jgi:hypothetical protein
VCTSRAVCTVSDNAATNTYDMESIQVFSRIRDVAAVPEAYNHHVPTKHSPHQLLGPITFVQGHGQALASVVPSRHCQRTKATDDNQE